GPGGTPSPDTPPPGLENLSEATNFSNPQARKWSWGSFCGVTAAGIERAPRLNLTSSYREIRHRFPAPPHRAGGHFRGELPARRTSRELANCGPVQRGTLADASEHPDALIRVYAVRTVRWRGIFAVHSWIIVKERGASHYTRYDYTAWGEPIRVDGFAPDGRWFGALPETILSVDGDEAERLIPKI